jgi:hypothetical protein
MLHLLTDWALGIGVEAKQRTKMDMACKTSSPTGIPVALDTCLMRQHVQQGTSECGCDCACVVLVAGAGSHVLTTKPSRCHHVMRIPLSHVSHHMLHGEPATSSATP